LINSGQITEYGGSEFWDMVGINFELIFFFGRLESYKRSVLDGFRIGWRAGPTIPGPIPRHSVRDEGGTRTGPRIGPSPEIGFKNKGSKTQESRKSDKALIKQGNLH